MDCTENSELSDLGLLITKLGKCEVCSCNEAKYTCPRCEVKTCCLQCVKIHKQELDCSGIRDRTKFVPLKKFTNLDLSSDYRLLEEINRNFAVVKKNNNKLLKKGQGRLPARLRKLCKVARLRRTNLHFLPNTFARRKTNATSFVSDSNTIFWHVEWIFANADNLKLSDCVPETARLNNLLCKYLTKQENRILQEKLQYYQAAGLCGLKILLQAEKKKGCKYYELDPFASLKDNLKNKAIVEHPIIHIVLRQHTSSYSILDSDDDNEEEVANSKNVVSNIIKKAEMEDTVDNSLRNLLFASDGEISD